MATTFQDRLIVIADAAFWDKSLSDDLVTSQDDWDNATLRAKAAVLGAIVQDVHSPELSEAIGPLSATKKDQLPILVGKLAPDLAIPLPSPIFELAAWRLSVVAALGAVLGLFTLGPLSRILLDLRDVGLFVGAPTGAALAVWLSVSLANNVFMKSMLSVGLGAAMAADVAIQILKHGTIAKIWSLIAKAKTETPRKRWFAYLLVLFILLLSKKDPRIDVSSAKTSVNGYLAMWVESVMANLRVLASSADAVTAQDRLEQLLPTINTLSTCGPDQLPSAVGQLLTKLGNLGITIQHGVALPASLTWTTELAEAFDTFDAVEPGNQFRVMRQPIRNGDKVVQKGLVRRSFEG